MLSVYINYLILNRSVTLVGEKGRKVLKEVVKQAKVPPKSRVVSPSVVEKYKEKIKSIENEIAEIMKQEEEEKEVCMDTCTCVFDLLSSCGSF